MNYVWFIINTLLLPLSFTQLKKSINKNKFFLRRKKTDAIVCTRIRFVFTIYFYSSGFVLGSPCAMRLNMSTMSIPVTASTVAGKVEMMSVT